MTSRRKLGEVLTQVSRPVAVADLDSVPYAGVRWYAGGVYERDVVDASSVKGKTLSRIHAGDVVYNRMWATKASFGVAGQDVDGCLVTNDFPSFVTTTGEALDRYIGLLFHDKAFQERASARATGTTERRRLKEPDFLDIEVYLPTLPEQKRIVDLIGALDEAIEAAEENEALATDARVAMAARSFALLTAVATAPLSEVAETRLGKMLSANVNKGTPAFYVRNADVQWNSINLTGLKSMPFSDVDRGEYSIKRGDVLICEGGEIGRSAVVLHDLDSIFFQKAIHRVRCGDTLLPEFLQAYMHHLALSGGLENFSGGTTIPHLTGVNLRQLPIPVVQIADQRALVTILDALNSNSSSLNTYAASLRTLRTNLLTALLSGTHEIPASYDDLISEAV